MTSAPNPLTLADFVPGADARRREAAAYRGFVRVLGRPVAQPAPSDRAPVVLVPGFVSGEISLAVLARHLRRRGFRTFGSGVGANLGCTQDMVERALRRVEQVATAEGRPVALVGHSRGGMIAKLVAIRRRDLVSCLVVLSAPVTGELRVAVHVRKQLELLFRLQQRGVAAVLGEDCVTGRCAQQVVAELEGQFPESVPYTSIYSRNDAIIDWRTCQDPAAERVEVAASHTGMGNDAAVAEIVIDCLGNASDPAAPSVCQGPAR